jgi:DNA-binding NtrC family response regulator
MAKRLLFVDDERSIRETLSAILRRYGFKVTLAAAVPEALHKIATQEFDLLLCDLNIEAENDGLGIIRAMRKVCPECVIILLTAYPSIATAVEGIHLGIDDYITKPTSADQLVALLAEKLALREQKLAEQANVEQTTRTLPHGDPFIPDRKPETIQ